MVGGSEEETKHDSTPKSSLTDEPYQECISYQMYIDVDDKKLGVFGSL